MGKFNLSNLRELSTEEQLLLNGGANSEDCSCSGCSVSCSCAELDHESTDAIKEGVKEQVRSKNAKKSEN